MYKNEEMDAINKTLGQGFVIRISDYIMYNKKNPIIAKEVSDGYVIAALQYVLSKDGGFVPAAYIEHYVRSENGMDTTTGEIVELASARPEPDFEKLKALTFEVDVDELVKIGESIKVKH